MILRWLWQKELLARWLTPMGKGWRFKAELLAFLEIAHSASIKVANFREVFRSNSDWGVSNFLAHGLGLLLLLFLAFDAIYSRCTHCQVSEVQCNTPHSNQIFRIHSLWLFFVIIRESPCNLRFLLWITSFSSGLTLNSSFRSGGVQVAPGQSGVNSAENRPYLLLVDSLQSLSLQ